MNNELKIIVCAHKADSNIRKNNIYMPIHVGKSLSDQNLGFQGDNTGDNISYKNKNYCELTGLYWAWKNLNCEYIGLVHYRRYFDVKDEDILEYLTKYDIILASPIRKLMSMQEQLLNYCLGEDYCIMMLVIKNICPQYYNTAVKYFSNNKCSPYNMFIASKKIVNAYSQWLFSILSEVEKYIRLSSYSRAARVYGYLAEHLLSIYCIHNNLKIKYIPIIIEDEQCKSNAIRHSLINITFSLKKFFTHKDDILSSKSCFMVGLKNDGIINLING